MLFVDCRYLAVQFKKYKTRNSVFVFQMCNTELYIESTARNVHGKWDQCNNGSFLTIKSDCDWYLQTEHLKYSWWFNVWKNKKKRWKIMFCSTCWTSEAYSLYSVQIQKIGFVLNLYKCCPRQKYVQRCWELFWMWLSHDCYFLGCSSQSFISEHVYEVLEAHYRFCLSKPKSSLSNLFGKLFLSLESH